jgi:hypothetical protein
MFPRPGAIAWTVAQDAQDAQGLGEGKRKWRQDGSPRPVRDHGQLQDVAQGRETERDRFQSDGDGRGASQVRVAAGAEGT